LQYAAPRWKEEPEIDKDEIDYTKIHNESSNDDAKGKLSERKAQSENPMNLSVTPIDDSPESMDLPWSIKSILSGSVESSGTLGRSRQIDVYQTYSTFFSDEDLKDLGPLVVRNRMSRLEVPFRTCRRENCSRRCCVSRPYEQRKPVTWMRHQQALTKPRSRGASC